MNPIKVVIDIFILPKESEYNIEFKIYNNNQLVKVMRDPRTFATKKKALEHASRIKSMVMDRVPGGRLYNSNMTSPSLN